MPQQRAKGAATTQPYPGSSLDPFQSEIRVLHLLPAAFEDEIQIELEVVSLDIYEKGPTFGAPYLEKTIDLDKRSQARGYDGHRLDLIPRERSLTPNWTASICSASPCKCYEALSYTWDPQGKKQAVSLNGYSGYLIMENLFKALRRLRWEHNSRTLWVDALCISQVDDGEKAEQVRLMSRIFNSAARVVVWLGDTENSSKVTHRSLFKHFNVTKTSHQSVPESTEARTVALRNALMNAERFWWERAWIIQEYILATNTPVLCFGPYLVEDTELLDFLNNIGDHQSRHPLRAALHTIQSLRATVRAGGKGPITRHISTMRKAFATDPRDKVFSILGMVQEQEANKIRVDYKPTYTTAQVYARATCVSLDSEGNLGPLKHVDFRDRDVKLPSWAVDFDCSDIDLKQAAAPNWRPWRSKWCSSDPHPDPWYELHFDSLNIQLRGYSLDKVLYVIPFPLRTLFQGAFDGDPIPPQPAAMEEYIWALRNLPPTNPYAALIHQGSQLSSQASVDWTELLNATQQPPANDMTAFRWLEKLFFAWADALALTTSLESLRTDRVGLINEWVRYAQYAGGNTVAFTTEKGFLGLAPATIQTGDEIALLFGSNVPTLLRPAGYDWFFRGFGHVWGISMPNSEPYPTMLAGRARVMLSYGSRLECPCV